MQNACFEHVRISCFICECSWDRPAFSHWAYSHANGVSYCRCSLWHSSTEFQDSKKKRKSCQRATLNQCKFTLCFRDSQMPKMHSASSTYSQSSQVAMWGPDRRWLGIQTCSQVRVNKDIQNLESTASLSHTESQQSPLLARRVFNLCRSMCIKLIIPNWLYQLLCYFFTENYLFSIVFEMRHYYLGSAKFLGRTVM